VRDQDESTKTSEQRNKLVRQDFAFVAASFLVYSFPPVLLKSFRAGYRSMDIVRPRDGR
jgi:hypothetical protein